MNSSCRQLQDHEVDDYDLKKTRCNHASINKFASCIDSNHHQANILFRTGSSRSTCAKNVDKYRYATWEQARNSMLVLIRTHLASKNISIPKSVDSVPSEVHSEQFDQFGGSEDSEGSILCKVESYQGFIKEACHDKSTSLIIQSAIAASSPNSELVKVLVKHSERGYAQLSKDKYGSYVLQRLAIRSVRFARFLQYVLAEANGAAEDFLTNEYSSRLIQLLAEWDQLFLERLMNKFCSQWEYFSRSMPAIFCLAACIRLAPPKFHRTVLQLLLRNGVALLHSKHIKRILVSLIEVCGEEELNVLYEFFLGHFNLHNMMNDKYLAIVLLSLLNRRVVRLIKCLERHMEKSLFSLMRTRYFKFIISRILRPDTKSNNEGILRILRNYFLSASWKNPYFAKTELLFVAYFLLSNLSNQQTSELSTIFASVALILDAREIIHRIRS